MNLLNEIRVLKCVLIENSKLLAYAVSTTDESRCRAHEAYLWWEALKEHLLLQQTTIHRRLHTLETSDELRNLRATKLELEAQIAELKERLYPQAVEGIEQRIVVDEEEMDGQSREWYVSKLDDLRTELERISSAIRQLNSPPGQLLLDFSL
jgi:hypothetical protein